MKLKLTLLLFLISIPSLAFSQNVISENEKDTVIERVKELIDSNYVFTERVEYVNNALSQLDKTGKYDEIKGYEDFAKALTEDLVGITKDKHFLVNYNPEFIKSRRVRRERNEESEAEVEEESIDWNRWYAIQENFGFQKVEVLDGNIGYIKITFFQPLDWVQPTIDAAMGFIANTGALIIDLTENQGGYSPTDSYLGSFFFDDEPRLWMSSYDRPTGETSSESTFQEVGGERYLNKPVLILVGENTFSLAEKFAYSMKHFGKANIIGQASAGAAHAINFLEIDENYGIQVPVLYNIHPITKTDWEGVGVKPDKVTSKEETLRLAYLEALNRLIDNAEYKEQKKRYNEIKARISK